MRNFKVYLNNCDYLVIHLSRLLKYSLSIFFLIIFRIQVFAVDINSNNEFLFSKASPVITFHYSEKFLLHLIFIIAAVISCLFFIILQKNRIIYKKDENIRHYSAALQSAFDEIYEYHNDTGVCYLLQENNGILRRQNDSSNEIRIEDMIYPEDFTRIENKFNLKHSQITTNMSDFHIEARGLGKDGKYHWLNIYFICADTLNNSASFYLFIKNIDYEKKRENQRIKAERRLQLALRGLFDEVFEINIMSGTYTILKHDDKKFNTDPPKEGTGNYHDYFSWFETFVYPEDLECIKQRFNLKSLQQAFVAGQDQIYAEFLRRDSAENYRWSSLMFLRDPNVNSFSYLAILQDIHERKHELEQLQNRAERDALTTLYNKGTTEILIKNYLSGQGQNNSHAFFIIDIDDFKNVNDCLGHPAGDLTLSYFADNLKNYFRADDIIGRIGGDEFVVFMKNIKYNTSINSKAYEICDLFKRSFSNEEVSFPITGSVGIAVYPHDGNSYEDIYRNADAALYSAKRMGKNQYRFYSDLESNLKTMTH